MKDSLCRSAKHTVEIQIRIVHEVYMRRSFSEDFPTLRASPIIDKIFISILSFHRPFYTAVCNILKL